MQTEDKGQPIRDKNTAFHRDGKHCLSHRNDRAFPKDGCLPTDSHFSDT